MSLSETKCLEHPAAEVIMAALALDKGADPDPWFWADDAAAVLNALRDAGYTIVRGETRLDHGQMVILRIGLDVQPGDTP